MTTIRDILSVLAVFAGYGIAGGMDYAEETRRERQREEAPSFWRDCVAELAMRDIVGAAPAQGHAPGHVSVE